MNSNILFDNVIPIPEIIKNERRKMIMYGEFRSSSAIFGHFLTKTLLTDVPAKI
jgi:hypothetical protein